MARGSLLGHDVYFFRQNIRSNFNKEQSKLSRFEITKMLIAVKNTFIVLPIITFDSFFVPCSYHSVCVHGAGDVAA